MPAAQLFSGVARKLNVQQAAEKHQNHRTTVDVHFVQAAAQQASEVSNDRWRDGCGFLCGEASIMLPWLSCYAKGKMPTAPKKDSAQGQKCEAWHMSEHSGQC